MKKLILFLIAVFFVSGSQIYSQRILLSEGFENGPYTVDSLPLKWLKVKVNSTTCTSPMADWRVRDSGKAFCGTNALTAYFTKAFGGSRKSLSIPWTASGATANDWVFTDSLRIATGDSLIFWCQLGTWSGAVGTHYTDSMQVWITTSQAPSVTGYLGTVRSLPSGANNVWQNIKYDLSAYNGQKVYVAFRYYMNLAVDGIMVNVDSVMVRNMNGPPVAINNNNGLAPDRFDLKQNYPNPFNPSTSIAYDIPTSEFVNITVFNSIGQQVAVLVNEQKAPGSYEINFDASSLPSGVYLYRIKAGDYSKSIKMSLIK